MEKHCHDNTLTHIDANGNQLCMGLCALAATTQDRQLRVRELEELAFPDTMTASSRPFDSFGRWGGEEFPGIIRHTDRAGLMATR